MSEVGVLLIFLLCGCLIRKSLEVGDLFSNFYYNELRVIEKLVEWLSLVSMN